MHTDASYAAGYYSGNSTYANPAQFGILNNSHAGFQFSHWFHPTPNGSWTNYGANTSYVTGPGWSNWESRDEWLAGDPVKIRVGIDENGFIAISSLQDDNGRITRTFCVPCSSGRFVPLGIKAGNQTARVYSQPKVHLLEPAAPTMNWVLSVPDGVYQYPLFATEEEANYYDQNHTIGSPGTGTSLTHVFADDPTNTTWYMADTGSTMTDTSDPIGTSFMGQVINYTEITSLSNADLAPPAFADTTITVDEFLLNYQLSPGRGYVTTIWQPNWSLAGGTIWYRPRWQETRLTLTTPYGDVYRTNVRHTPAP